MFYGQCWKCGERWEFGTASSCKCPDEEPVKFAFKENNDSTEVLRVTAEGKFIWHEDADRMIEEGDFSQAPALPHILRALRKQRHEQEPVAYSYTSRITGAQGFSHHPMPRFVDSESWDIKPLYTQQFTYIASPKQELAGWKLVPIEPTNQMLKAMDECSTEGYDERLYAGHAASVYMAAVDVAPTPPQRKEDK